MIPYRISPYLYFVENRLVPGVIQYGVAHRLTGEVLEPGERVRALLLSMQAGNRISLSQEQLNGFGEAGTQLKQLIEREFLIPAGHDPLARFVNQYVVRPIQNPALIYRAKDGNIHLVRTSLSHQIFSPLRGELPEVIEEEISQFAAAIFELADGTRTLQEIFAVLGRNEATIDGPEFGRALEFLTSRERQLIKFTSHVEDIDHPYKPVNIVPRDLYHSSKWNSPAVESLTEPIIDFHLSGIEDAEWEFDLIEPTVNHSFRFPNEALGGLDYGSRFCVSTLRADVVPALRTSAQIKVLEVGGGTGTFARSFLEQSKRLEVLNGIRLDYHILDLSPALIENQRKLLADILPPIRHFHQDATKFSIPEKFDLIIANEVIADFPVAIVERSSDNPPSDAPKHLASDMVRKWQGPGARYVERYGLSTDDAPDSFLVNAGACDFIERCFEHLAPGGSLLVSEYGTAERFPVEAHQLNHEEFSIHFGHLASCAASVGFKCRLLTLKEFLAVDDSILVLNGRQDHFLTLNYVLKKYGMSLPYAVISKTEFENQLQNIIEQIELKGFSFSALNKGYYAGPRIDDFMILIMTKPLE